MPEDKLQELERRIASLEEDKTVSKYDNPFDFIDIQNITGFVQVVSTTPAGFPKNMFDQVKIYINGGTLRLYVYDYANNAWRYTTLT